MRGLLLCLVVGMSVPEYGRCFRPTLFFCPQFIPIHSCFMPKDFENRIVQVKFKPASKTIKIESTTECVRFLNVIWDKDLFNIQEQFYVAFLDLKNSLICWRCLNTGSFDSSIVDVKLLFALSAACFANKMIIAHNHPSGYPEPSEEDKRITKKIQESANCMGVKLLDHIILSRSGYYSFLESGGLK